LLIILGKTGAPVSMTHGITFINEMINNTTHQQELIKYKEKHGSNQSEDEVGRIGRKYWYKFLERNKDRIVSKRGKRYKLDHSRWTRYKNFKNMYDDVKD
jgi:hypothetical protein